MKGQTRNKMIVGALDLLRRRGLNATSVREVVKHSQTPRGSVQHHFPGGKQQLVEEAMNAAKELVSLSLSTSVTEKGLKSGVIQFIDDWQKMLIQGDYQVGCPILAVVVEQYISDDGTANHPAQDAFLTIADSAFSEWQNVFSSAMIQEGYGEDRARSLARLIVCSVEGALVMCRASKSLAPLEDIKKEISLLLENS